MLTHAYIDEVFLKAAETFGIDNQMNIAQEELCELGAAISRVKRGRPGARENLVEEIADALVVIWQLQIVFDPDGKVAEIFEEKVKRLAGRIEAGRDW